MVGDWSLCGGRLYGMPGTDTDDVLCGTDVVNVVSVRQKILLTGTCWYELTGLWYLLSAQGYDVYRAPSGYICAQDGWDLIIVALSAEPVAGWGRNLSRIRELRLNMSGKILVLVPDMLKNLRMLQDIGPVFSGCVNWRQVSDCIRKTLNGETKRTRRFRLTDGQRCILQQCPSVKMTKPKMYYHHARLAGNVGVGDFRMLLMTGLNRAIHEMADGQSEI